MMTRRAVLARLSLAIPRPGADLLELKALHSCCERPWAEHPRWE